MGVEGESRVATFLFTDIEGSTRLLEQLGDDFAPVLSEHWEVLREAASMCGGVEFGAEGDAMFFAFDNASGAAAAAAACQAALADHVWPTDVDLRVRIAIHTGVAQPAFGTWVGLAVHQTARACMAGHGGQVLVSAATRELLADDLPRGSQLRDLGEYSLRDIATPQRLFQLEAVDAPRDFPPLRTPATMVDNLPDQLTTFVGRQAEVVEVRARLTQTRLLTLTGAGGCGKTRLALEVAADVVPTFEGGVWYVALDTLTEAVQVPAAAASAIGVVERQGQSIERALVDALRDRAALIVLDNCEHLVEACAYLVETLIRSCPKLKVLATGREELGINGEVAWRVPSLSLPKAGEPIDPTRLGQYEAVRLFIDRATRTRESFDVTAANAEAVVAICRRLDGIPLAIELAAARVAFLTVEQINQRLNDRFRLLTGGSRTAMARQQTLRALVDWSHDLLAPTEQALFRRLSVFSGGFTLEAAEAVASGGGVPEAEVLDLLGQIVRKSLVLAEPAGDADRYRLLETMREYGREKLIAADEVEDLRDRHLNYFLELSEEARPKLVGPEQADWLDRLDADHENLKLALDWALGARTHEGLSLAGNLGQFWAVRGYTTEGRRLLGKALDHAGDIEDPEALDPAEFLVRLIALNNAGIMAREQGDYADARRRHEDQLELVRARNDEAQVARALSNLGSVAMQEGDAAQAGPLFEESLEIRRQLGDPRSIAYSVNNLGVLADHNGEDEKAREYFEEHLRIMRDLGDTRAVAHSLANLGMTAVAFGELDEGASMVAEARALMEGLGDTRGVAISRLNDGYISLLRCAETDSTDICRSWPTRVVSITPPCACWLTSTTPQPSEWRWRDWRRSPPSRTRASGRSASSWRPDRCLRASANNTGSNRRCGRARRPGPRPPSGQRRRRFGLMPRLPTLSISWPRCSVSRPRSRRTIPRSRGASRLT